MSEEYKSVDPLIEKIMNQLDPLSKEAKDFLNSLADERARFLENDEMLRKQVEPLEQQLKTARADGVREFKQWLIDELGDEHIDPEDCDLIVSQDDFEEYANNLEGK